MRIYSTIILLLFALSVSAQFRMVGTSGGWSVVDDSTYTATITFQSDLTGQGYLATQIADTFRLITPTEQLYRVSAVANATFNTADLTVIEYDGTNGTPVGQVMVYNPDGKTTIPQAPFGSTGSTAQMQAAVDSYNARLIGTGGTGAVASVNGNTGTVVLDPDDLDDSATTNKFTTAGDISKLAGIEAGATADQAAAEVVFTPAGTISATDVQAAISEAYTDAIAALSEVKVTDYGAIADDGLDDSGAFRSALAASATRILVPPGEYNFSNDITVSSRKQLVFLPGVKLQLLDDFDGDQNREISAKYRGALFWVKADTVKFDFANTVINMNQDSLETVDAQDYFMTAIILDTINHFISDGGLIVEKAHNGVMSWESDYVTLNKIEFSNAPNTVEKRNTPCDLQNGDFFFINDIRCIGGEEGIDINGGIRYCNANNIYVENSTEGAIELNSSTDCTINNVTAVNCKKVISLSDYGFSAYENENIVFNNITARQTDGTANQKVIDIQDGIGVTITNFSFFSNQNRNNPLIFLYNAVPNEVQNIRIQGKFVITGTTDVFAHIENADDIVLDIEVKSQFASGDTLLLVNNESDFIQARIIAENTSLTVQGTALGINDQSTKLYIHDYRLIGFDTTLEVNRFTEFSPPLKYNYSQLPDTVATGQQAYVIDSASYFFYTLTDGWVNMSASGSGPPAGGSFNSTYQAIIDYANSQVFTLPSDSVQNFQNLLIDSLVTSGVWDSLDVFYVLSGDGNTGFKKMNWKNPGGSFDLTTPNEPIYNYMGATGDGIGYLDTNYSPDPDSINYGRDNSSIGIWIHDTTTLNIHLMSTSNPSPGYANMYLNGSLKLTSRHHGATNRTSTASLTVPGLVVSNRPTRTQHQQYVDGALDGTSNITALGVPSEDFPIFGKRSGAAVTDKSDATISVVWLGGSVGTFGARIESWISTYQGSL